MSIRLHYELHCTPERAVEKLKTLALPEYQEGILDNADIDRSGRIVRVSLTWQKRGNRMNPEWDNTSLGGVEIRDGALNIEVNSDKRAAKIRREIQDRLGDLCVFLKEDRQSIESLLDQERGPAKVHSPRRRETEDRPEFRAALKQQMKAHWEAWLDKPIPALKNQTPRQAARTPAALERLEALLMEMERRSESVIQPELRPDLPELRRKLGLKI